MIDTLQIYYTFKTKKEYFNVLQLLNNYMKKKKTGNFYKDKKDANCHVLYGLANKGFEEIKFRNNGAGYLAIEILLRPKLLVDKENYINVLHEHEIKDANKEFNRIIQNKLQLQLPDFFKWRVKRIDYAIDINVKQKLMPHYMKLFSKSNIPEYALKNTTTQKYLNETNNLYICCNKYHVNFYDRYTTLQIKQSKSKKIFKNIDAAKNLMRFEIQIMVDTNRLKHKKRINENTVGDFLKISLCQHYILHHFNTIIGDGDYYTLEAAKRYIIKNGKSLSSLFPLRKILELIYNKDSIPKAKKAFIKSEDNKKKAAKKFSEYINMLRHMGINPITLTSEMSSELDTESLKGLGNKIKTYFDNTNSIEYLSSEPPAIPNYTIIN